MGERGGDVTGTFMMERGQGGGEWGGMRKTFQVEIYRPEHVIRDITLNYQTAAPEAHWRTGPKNRGGSSGRGQCALPGRHAALQTPG